MARWMVHITAIVAIAAAALAQPAPIARDPSMPAIRRAVNFGNMLESPREGDWGLKVQPEYFRRVREAGLDGVRLPVSWTHHAAADPPYTIDPAFMDRVDWCVDRALENDLSIIVNSHHHDALNADPERESARALAIWDQIATHMKDRPPQVLFEVLNEPHGAFNQHPQLWHDYLAHALAVIRRTNPTRWVLAGPVRWNSIAALDGFTPPSDPRLIISVHYYEPFAFTHQGAGWIDPPPPVGRDWDPGHVGVAQPWDNWSWKTRLTPGAAGLVIEPEQGWAGASFHRASAIAGVRAIEFHVDRPVTLRVVATRGTAERALTIQAEGECRVELPADFTEIDRVSLQYASDAPAEYVLTRLRVVTDTGAEPLIRSAGEEIDAAMARASAWARARSLPIHLGEFGAYSKGGLPSRAAWTHAVRTAAERHGIAWAYWEFGAGFGIYDPEADVWRRPLLDALILD